jgi:hypothetical protein
MIHERQWEMNRLCKYAINLLRNRKNWRERSVQST